MVRPFKIPLKRKQSSPTHSLDDPVTFLSNDEASGDSDAAPRSRSDGASDARAIASGVYRSRACGDFARLVEMSLSDDDRTRARADAIGEVVEATPVAMSHPPRGGDASSDDEENDAHTCAKAIHEMMTKAEHARRVSDALDAGALALSVREGISEMMEASARASIAMNDDARALGIRIWNYVIEKTALETNAGSGKMSDESFVKPLLDLRACSCELMDYALGYPGAMKGRAEASDVVAAMLNHAKVATLLCDDERFKDAEEQFMIMESYGNHVVNEEYELDDDALLRVFEAMTTRAKCAFRMGSVGNARDFFDSAKHYFSSQKRQANGELSDSDAVGAMALVNAKINLAETFVVPLKTSAENVRIDFDERIKYLIGELEESYGSLFKFVPNSWSSPAQKDDAVLLTLDESLMRKDVPALRSDGLYIRILHHLAQLFIYAGRYADALSALEKLKVIKRYIKKCKSSDHLFMTDADALTGTFLMDNMLVEALSGVGETSKASDVLESMLSDEHVKTDVLQPCCVKLAGSEYGASVVVEKIAPLVAKLRSHPAEVRREMVTEIFDGLLHTITTANDMIAENVTRAFERVLSDGKLMRDIGFSHDGKSQAYAIIWNAAVEMYLSGKYTLARHLFGMTVPLASQRKSKSGTSQLVAIIRLQTMCDLENGNLERARESLRGLLSQHPADKELDASTRLLQIKIQLASQDFCGLEESIILFARSGEADALLYVAGELDRCEHHATAAIAFHKLYTMFLDGSCSNNMRDQESFIFCSYLNHLQASKSAHDGSSGFDKETTTRVAEMFQSFAARVTKQSSLLNDEHQAKYLADYSWNIGLEAYSASNTESAYVFMFVCALIVKSLLKLSTSMVDDSRTEYSFRQAAALLLAIASLTSGESSDTSAVEDLTPKSREEARKAREARNITRSKQAMAQLRGILDGGIDERFKELRNIARVLEYEIACAEKNVALQIKIVGDLVPKDADHSSVTTLLLIADRGVVLRNADLVTVSHAYEEVMRSLKKHAAQDIKAIARVMRKRIQLSSRMHKSKDDAVHVLYTEAEELCQAYHDTYSPVEAQWLVSTCFNRAVRHERSMRNAQALEWLKQTKSLLIALDSVLPDTMSFKSTVDENIAVLSATAELEQTVSVAPADCAGASR